MTLAQVAIADRVVYICVFFGNRLGNIVLYKSFAQAGSVILMEISINYQDTDFAGLVKPSDLSQCFYVSEDKRKHTRLYTLKSIKV